MTKRSEDSNDDEKQAAPRVVPRWADHVLQGVPERTRASYVVEPQAVQAELDRLSR